MNTKIYYVSPKGSARAIAEAISQATKATKEALMPAYMPENVSLMFLGCEGTKADATTVEFLSSLNNKRVRNAALYSCNPKQDESALAQMKGILTEKGINVVACKAFPGKGFLSGKQPGENDLKAAAEFAQQAIAAIK